MNTNTYDTYNITFTDGVLKVGFGTPAQNDQIVRDAKAKLDSMIKSGILAGGEVLKVNGPASLPVAMTIAHAVAHLYQVVAVFDPKLAKYVVATSHGADHHVGDLID